MPRGIEAVLAKSSAGFDELVTEKYQDHVAAVFERVERAASAIPSEYGGIRKGYRQRFLRSVAKTQRMEGRVPKFASSGLEGGLETRECCDEKGFLGNGVPR